MWDKDSDIDTDDDGIADSKEAYEEEEIDMSEFIKIYCDYNHLNSEEREEYMNKYSKITVHNYRSNPVLPDTDFDGRDDSRDIARAMDNNYKGEMSTYNYDKVKFDMNMDYRYFFMNNDKYYAELSEMSLILANMILKNNTGNMTWHNETEGWTSRSIINHMWYMGMKDSEYYNTGKTPYAIGYHDAVFMTGKNNKRVKNVIGIVVGEDLDTKDDIISNIDGRNGVDGEYNNFHHVGYDIEANKIFKTIVEYDNSHRDTNNVYWVVGYGVGGSIANLVAKKLIDYRGSETVFAYTFESNATVNMNRAEEKISNRKYYPIINVNNKDNANTQILTREDNWYRYGKAREYSISNNNKYKETFYNKTGEHYRGLSSIVKKLKDIIKGIGNVFGFTGAINDPLGLVATNDIKNHPVRIQAAVALRDAKDQAAISSGIDILKSDEVKMEEEFSLPDLTEWEIKYVYDLGDSEDATPWGRDTIVCEYCRGLRVIKPQGNVSRENSIRYDNFTIQDNEVRYVDINFSNLWNSKGDGSPLLNYHTAGDMSRKGGALTQEQWVGLDDIENIGKDEPPEVFAADNLDFTIEIDEVPYENPDLIFGDYGAIRMVDGRFLSAFTPMVLGAVKPNIKARELFHKKSSWENKTDITDDSFHGMSLQDGKYPMGSYVDVVFEDTNTGKQFVVPFIAFDEKKLHSQLQRRNIIDTERESLYLGQITDNRFGQVNEKLQIEVDSDGKPKGIDKPNGTAYRMYHKYSYVLKEIVPYSDEAFLNIYGYGENTKKYIFEFPTLINQIENLETKRWYEGETFTLKERFTIEVEDREFKKG